MQRLTRDAWELWTRRAHRDPPLWIGPLFRRVRAQVLSSTNGQHRPHEYQSLVGEHYLRAAPAVTSVEVHDGRRNELARSHRRPE